MIFINRDLINKTSTNSKNINKNTKNNIKFNKTLEITAKILIMKDSKT